MWDVKYLDGQSLPAFSGEWLKQTIRLETNSKKNGVLRHLRIASVSCIES